MPCCQNSAYDHRSGRRGQRGGGTSVTDEIGRDTITDFDAEGGTGDRDLLNLQGMTYTAEKLGKHDTLITFDGDQEIVLLGVKPKEIDDTDFMM